MYLNCSLTYSYHLLNGISLSLSQTDHKLTITKAEYRNSFIKSDLKFGEIDYLNWMITLSVITSNGFHFSTIITSKHSITFKADFFKYIFFGGFFNLNVYLLERKWMALILLRKKQTVLASFIDTSLNAV